MISQAKFSSPPLNTEHQGPLTGGQRLSLGGGYFVDAALLVDEAALDHFEVQVARHLCDQQHAHKLT